MTIRITILLLAGLFLTSCAMSNQPVTVAKKEQEILNIYPNGTMELNGRIMNEEDVIIYEDGRGGERAAVKLMIPRRPDVYRDTIIVERIVKDVSVTREM